VCSKYWAYVCEPSVNMQSQKVSQMTLMWARLIEQWVVNMCKCPGVTLLGLGTRAGVIIWIKNMCSRYSRHSSRLPWTKNVQFFQFLSSVHAKVANSNPKNYEISNQYSIYWEHKSPYFQNFKIRLECLGIVLLLALEGMGCCS